MNGTYKPGGNMNLSGTQGLGLDMEPWAYEARGRNSGRKQGLREGREEGYAEGFDDGMAEGVSIGRRQAIIEANKVIENINAKFGRERKISNRLSVSSRALRCTLETLIENNPNSATYIRRLFRGNYEKEVINAQSNGSIDRPPHMDLEFARDAPLMNAFINSTM